MVFTLSLSAEENLRKLSIQIKAMPGQLILLAWQKAYEMKRHTAQSAVAEHIPTLPTHLLGVIDQKPRILAWPNFSLPLERYLIGDEKIIHIGAFGPMEASLAGFNFLDCHDPEIADIPSEDNVSGLAVFVGDERVKQWFLKQAYSRHRDKVLIQYWRECRQLDYQLQMPEMDVAVTAMRGEIKKVLTNTLIQHLYCGPSSMKPWLEQAWEFGIDLEEVYQEVSTQLRQLLGLESTK